MLQRSPKCQSIRGGGSDYILTLFALLVSKPRISRIGHIKENYLELELVEILNCIASLFTGAD